MSPCSCFGLVVAMATGSIQNFKYNQKKFASMMTSSVMFKIERASNDRNHRKKVCGTIKACEILSFYAFFKCLKSK